MAQESIEMPKQATKKIDLTHVDIELIKQALDLQQKSWERMAAKEGNTPIGQARKDMIKELGKTINKL